MKMVKMNKKTAFVIASVTLLAIGLQTYLKYVSNPLDKKVSLIRISSDKEPSTLDPRLGSDLHAANVLRMLYDGLMRTDENGVLTSGLAEFVVISDDRKQYTFKLRESYWSDSSPVTAQDFEQSWKSSLNPEDPMPNAYQFYMIEGAKAYREGQAPISQVGISSPDEKTLIVKLEAPTPYFLKLTASHFFFPAHKSLRNKPNDLQDDTHLISNGPFVLSKWLRSNELSVTKNPLYWDAEKVKLDQIIMYVLDESTSLKMFEANELDWVGSPMGTIPQDAVTELKGSNRLQIVPASGTHWFRFNTGSFPTNNNKMRLALSYGLNRKEIVDHVTQGSQLPAYRLIPPTLDMRPDALFHDNDVSIARNFFAEALAELNLSKEQFSQITLSYPAADREHKIAQAVQQQWEKNLGIHVRLNSCEPKCFLQKVREFDYQIATGSWFADFSDPINFLEVFKYKTNSTNRTLWENEEFINLLNASQIDTNTQSRNKTLAAAEDLFIQQMPVAPLFFAAFNYVKNEKVRGVTLSDLGILDFKYARID